MYGFANHLAVIVCFVSCEKWVQREKVFIQGMSTLHLQCGPDECKDEVVLMWHHVFVKSHQFPTQENVFFEFERPIFKLGFNFELQKKQSLLKGCFGSQVSWTNRVLH